MKYKGCEITLEEGQGYYVSSGRYPLKDTKGIIFFKSIVKAKEQIREICRDFRFDPLPINFFCSVTLNK